ncbi:MAG: nucleoside triphosphate pyrophosphohydrolase, partial [Actinobacteria bacterium]|nr:nucleoside triphosphate pyrophosphohydrolase [Actinomycetota bacterium]
DAPHGAVPLDRYRALEDELGDLLYQVVFHATLAREAGAFTVRDVIAGIQDKLVRRHPHVFGDVEARTTDDVKRTWEEIKREERVAKGTGSALAGIDPALPALLYAHKLIGRAASLGVDPPAPPEAAAAVRDAAGALAGVGGVDADRSTLEDRLGELLGAVVALARVRGVDGETALRGWAGRLRARLETLEARSGPGGVPTSEAPDD